VPSANAKAGNKMFRQRNKLSYIRKEIHKLLGTRTQLYCSYAVANCGQEPEHAFKVTTEAP
jgi:hypothetical protein